VHEELRTALGTSPYERSGGRRGYATASRSGHSRDRPARLRSR
jgi:hypothetical protein